MTNRQYSTFTRIFLCVLASLLLWLGLTLSKSTSTLDAAEQSLGNKLSYSLVSNSAYLPYVASQKVKRTRTPTRTSSPLATATGTPTPTAIAAATSTSTQQTTFTLGETNVLGNNDSGNGNLLVAQKVTLAQTGILRSLSFYVTTASGKLQLGLYDSLTSKPHSLLASTNVFTPVAGWNTQGVAAITLAPGDYWLAYLPESGSLGFKLDYSGSAEFYSSPFGSLPPSFSSSATSIVSHWSFYAVLKTAAQTATPSGTLASSATATSTQTSAPAATASRTATSSPTAVSTSIPTSTPASSSYPLRASANGRYLVDQNNKPFLMVGDSPQSLIGNLSEADAATYFADRRAHGFNTVWINLLCNSYTACHADGTTYNSIPPFTTPGDLSTPNETYFAHVDRVLQSAANYGLLVVLDPIETGGWLSTLQANGTTKATNYGEYLGNRYKNFPNIIWMSGNDFQTWSNASDDALVTAVANGIKSTDANHIHTAELNYLVSSTLDDPNWAGIASLNAAYTYYPTYAEVLHAYNQSPTLPAFLVEEHYEGENVGGELGTPNVLRRQEYWALLSGATGQLYGNYYTWTFATGWQSNLDTVGVTQLDYVTGLFSSRAWYNLVPDQSHAVVTAGYGTFSTTGNVSANDYLTAARTPDGNLVIAYMPTRRTITVDMTKLSGPATARWYDPTNGTYTSITGSPFTNTGTHQFTPTASNGTGDGDWVLVLER